MMIAEPIAWIDVKRLNWEVKGILAGNVLAGGSTVLSKKLLLVFFVFIVWVSVNIANGF